jgi:uncharacterized protein (TIGR02001 family)
MKHKSLSLLALSLLAGSVYAQGMTYNIGVVNNYLYRGITQTRGEPAVQGGLDYAHKSGLYVGAWASSIKWIEDNSTTTAGVTGPTELDIYGGYKFDLAPNTTMDLGFLRYEYLNNTLVKNTAYSNANTDELYVGLSTPFSTSSFLMQCPICSDNAAQLLEPIRQAPLIPSSAASLIWALATSSHPRRA